MDMASIFPGVVDRPLRVGTHNGVFHADDVFAVALLQMAFGPLEIIRTRDEDLLAKCAIVVDVGAVYSPDSHRYDHHQRGGAGARENGCPYSSFGLIWKHFGMLVLQDLPEGLRAAAWSKLDQELVQVIDASDCGITLYQTEEAIKVAYLGGLERPFTPEEAVVAEAYAKAHQPMPRFKGAEGISLSASISSLNSPPGGRSKDEGFKEAVQMASMQLKARLDSVSWALKSPGIVEEAVKAASDPRLIVLDVQAAWEETMKGHEKALFVVYPTDEGVWMVQAIPIAGGDRFSKRLALPVGWAGRRNKEFQTITGVKDGVFCHLGLFLCGAETKEGALALARLALQ